LKNNTIKRLIAFTALVMLCSESYAQTLLEEVVVTAQKRSQSVSDVPITVNALTGNDIEEFGVGDLFEMANLVPGLVFSRAPDDGLALTIRGLGTPARTQSFDQSVALFLDGLFLGKGRMYSSGIFDLDRVEVIKGTQSTLLGKNTSLGAISIVTKTPGDELSGNLKVGAEVENGGYSVTGGIDLPASENLKFRLAANISDTDGWVKNVLTGEDVPADKEAGFRLTGVYTPNDRMTATLRLQTTDSERSGNGFQFIDNGNFLSPEIVNILGEAQLDDTKTAICPECPGGESFHDTKVDSASLTLDYSIGDSLLTSITSYSQYEIKFFDDFDFGAAFDEVTFAIFNPGTIVPYSTYFERDEDYDQFSQEIRLVSPGGEKIDYVVGAYYFKSDWFSSEQQNWSTPNFPPPAPGQLFNGRFTNNFTQDTETVSVFASGTWNISDSFSTTLGLRYTDEKKDVRFQRAQGSLATLWNSVINPPFDSELEFDDSFLNGNFNLQYDLNDVAMFYASYGVGSKTGGFAESAEVGSANPALDVSLNGSRVETEETRTWELGTKLNLAGGAANLNIAFFTTDIDDFQETSFQVLGGQAFFLTRNIDVESKGFELDGAWQINDSLKLTGGLTYADSTNAGDDTKLAQAPEYTGSLGFVYDRELTSNLSFNMNGFVRYRDEMFSQINETFASDSLTTYDLTMQFIHESGWTFSIIGTNITDEVATDFSGPPAAPIAAIFGAPPGDQGITAEAPSPLRSVKLQLGYEF